jgi:DNA replication protein DnaC
MGKRFQQRTFENFAINANNQRAYEKAKDYADNFLNLEEGIGLMFVGDYGTGKTHLAAAIANDLLNNGIPVVFGTLSTLLGAIKKTWSDEKYDEHDIEDIYQTVDLLVIDDLGKEQVSEWTLSKLYSMINDRYENCRSVIITTNFGEGELIERLSTKDNKSTAESIVSRLIEMCSGVLLVGEDFRRK